MLQHNQMISVPFIEAKPNSRNIKKILVNAVGFGGNAVSILVSNSFLTLLLLHW
jgi:3-oxoacyl-[acyl-carrier-protein] synthase II